MYLFVQKSIVFQRNRFGLPIMTKPAAYAASRHVENKSFDRHFKRERAVPVAYDRSRRTADASRSPFEGRNP